MSEGTVARAMDLSFQERADPPDGTEFGTGASSILSYLVRAGELIPPWWSTARDAELRRFWKQSDHLSGVVRTVTNKASTLAWRIVPKDRAITQQVVMAEEATRILTETPEFGLGWNAFMVKWMQDLVTQDNGAFAEIIGPGRPDGPRIGRPVSLAHLDSKNCMRTRDPEFPVIYTDTDGQRYRLHYTRVMYASQMASSDVDMNGVGFCSTSSAVHTATNLLDMSIYKQEKLGSRPLRQMLIGSNISAEEILSALVMAEESMDNRALSRYAPIVAIGNKRKDIGLDQIDLASIPDGFDEEASTTLGMFTMALAFETDARDLWPATVSGATKADAMIQHLKSRLKGQGQTMQIIARQINQKFLPPTLLFEFNAQDDEQDMIQAEVRDQRSQTWDRDIASGSLTVRVVREQMLDKGDVTKEQFIQMELEDGRLADGTPVTMLFFSDDPTVSSLLDIGLDNPLNIRDNSAESALREIDKSINKVLDHLAGAQGQQQKRTGREALAALEHLRLEYEESAMQEEMAAQDAQAEVQGEPGRARQRTAADRERIRNEDDFRGDGSRSAVRAAIGKK